jgi:hypothetical protein
MPDGASALHDRRLTPIVPASASQPAWMSLIRPSSTQAMWGSEEHVRALFGDRVASLAMTRRVYVESAASPRDYRELFESTFGPVVAIYASLADQPARQAALEDDFMQFAERANRGAPEGPAEYPYEYLLVVARTAPG